MIQHKKAVYVSRDEDGRHLPTGLITCLGKCFQNFSRKKWKQLHGMCGPPTVEVDEHPVQSEHLTISLMIDVIITWPCKARQGEQRGIPSFYEGKESRAWHYCTVGTPYNNVRTPTSKQAHRDGRDPLMKDHGGHACAMRERLNLPISPS